jgi:predicted DNA-binding transcriptional regulator YafY
MIDLLRGRVHDRHTIAESLEVAVAAADRYLHGLTRVPGMVASREGRRLTIRFDVTEVVPRPSHAAAVAACWAGGLSDVFAGSEYEVGVREALEYVSGRARRSGEFTHVNRKFIFVSRGGESSLPESAPRLKELVEAVLRSRYVVITYLHFDGRVETCRVQPLSMAIYDHQIYLIGIGATGAPYPFRLSRIQWVNLTDEFFDYPNRPSYDPKQIFRDSFGIFISDRYPVARVQIRLPFTWRTHCLTHRWHASQQVEESKDGIVVSLVVRLCPELEAWIRGFGRDVVVLAPPALAKKLHAKRADTGSARRPARRAPSSGARPKKTQRTSKA